MANEEKTGWEKAGFPNPYLVTNTAVARAFIDAIVERYFFAESEKQKYEENGYVGNIHRPEILGGDKWKGGSYWWVENWDFMSVVDADILELLNYFYDAETFDGNPVVEGNTYYWGYSDLGSPVAFNNTQTMTHNVIEERGLYEGEELIPWQVLFTTWGEGDSSNPALIDNPSYWAVARNTGTEKTPLVLSSYLAAWADQRRRFLNLLKYRVLKISFHGTQYHKYVDVSGKYYSEINYKDILLQTIKHPDSTTTTGGIHGYRISLGSGWHPWKTSGPNHEYIEQGDASCSVYWLKSIKVQFEPGYNLLGREFIFKYQARKDRSYFDDFSSCFMPFFEGKNEWRFTAVENEVSFSVPMDWHQVRAVGDEIIFDYDWEQVPISTPATYIDEYQYGTRITRIPSVSCGLAIGNGLFTTDISDTYKYYDKELEKNEN
ncbi:MAG: hypothetical protein IKP00_07020 [Victivallales bacterium]|nr:hypothetical protein [Victivallales bacterium]